jgi:hypothetical protein
MATKTKTIETEETMEDLPFAPPEMHYLSERYILRLPLNDEHFESPWKLRVYITKVLERQLGDEAQVTSLRVKKPHLVAKGKAKLLKYQPTARLFVTVKF